MTASSIGSMLPRLSAGARTTGRLVAATGCMAMIFVAVLALFAWHEQSVVPLVVGIAAALAAGGVAALAGFIFGLPRFVPLVSSSTPTSGADGSPVGQDSGAKKSYFSPSNNLEQISDWLTKLLLGAGLVQLGAIGRWLSAAVNALSQGLAGSADQVASAKIVAGATVGLFGALGFLVGYVSTTLWYRQRLEALSQQE